MYLKIHSQVYCATCVVCTYKYMYVCMYVCTYHVRIMYIHVYMHTYKIHILYNICVYSLIILLHA